MKRIKHLWSLSILLSSSLAIGVDNVNRSILLSKFSADLSAYSNFCKINTLKSMGFNFESIDDHKGKISKSEFQDISTCSDSSISENKFFISLKSVATKEETSHFLDQVFKSQSSQCLFQKKYSQAVQAATKKLNYNYQYWFTPFWQQQNVKMSKLQNYWQKASCGDYNCYTPKENQSSQAINELYVTHYSTDCGNGLELAEYASAKELFQDKLFDKYFKYDELFIGDWEDISTSNSFTHGKNANRIPISNGLEYTSAGPLFLIGATGFIGSIYDESYLDSLTNINENFVITQISNQATSNLIQYGGIDYYNNILREVWFLTQSISKSELQALENLSLYNRLGKATGIAIKQQLTLLGTEAESIIPSELSEKIAKILSDPFLSETQIYVHPLGFKSIAWHILRLARINSRTPYAIKFYDDSIHSEVYNRWIKSQLDQCK